MKILNFTIKDSNKYHLWAHQIGWPITAFTLSIFYFGIKSEIEGNFSVEDLLWTSSKVFIDEIVTRIIHAIWILAMHRKSTNSIFDLILDGEHKLIGYTWPLIKKHLAENTKWRILSLFISFIVSGFYNLAKDGDFNVVGSVEYMLQIGGIRVILRLLYFIMLEVIPHNRFIHRDNEEDLTIKEINTWKWKRSNDPVAEDSKESKEEEIV